jgi:hypothetical protein
MLHKGRPFARHDPCRHRRVDPVDDHRLTVTEPGQHLLPGQQRVQAGGSVEGRFDGRSQLALVGDPSASRTPARTTAATLVNGLAPHDADAKFSDRFVVGVENNARECGTRRQSPIVASVRQAGNPGPTHGGDLGTGP